ALPISKAYRGPSTGASAGSGAMSPSRRSSARTEKIVGFFGLNKPGEVTVRLSSSEASRSMTTVSHRRHSSRASPAPSFLTAKSWLPLQRPSRPVGQLPDALYPKASGPPAPKTPAPERGSEDLVALRLRFVQHDRQLAHRAVVPAQLLHPVVDQHVAVGAVDGYRG